MLAGNIIPQSKEGELLLKAPFMEKPQNHSLTSMCLVFREQNYIDFKTLYRSLLLSSDLPLLEEVIEGMAT